MKYVLTGEEAQVLDKATQESFHMDDLVLMERAALSLSDEIKKRFSKDEKILFICGTGNNGADGVASARILFNQGYLNVVVCLALGKEKLSNAMQRQLSIAEAYNVPFSDDPFDTEGFNVIVDALFGTGLNREIEGRAKDLVDMINSSGAYVIACDTSSGIDHTVGAVNGPCVKA
ncbi:MAG: NAD(P)H-hydrate epimerase, partial [Lachnospiraceae bacterium]|nr:NAD(P)H-hydrate epimerase [Lachnospiraceae bacterium]